MTSDSWRATAEMIGIAAIVASLIFVGLELRQSQQIALASQYQERTDSGRQYFYESLNSQLRLEIQAEDIENWDWPPGLLSATDRQWLDEHSPTEWAEAAYWSVINLYGFDNYYYQYQSGFLSEEGWLALRARLRSMLRGDPFSRYLVVVTGDTFRESFVELAESLIAENDSE